MNYLKERKKRLLNLLPALTLPQDRLIMAVQTINRSRGFFLLKYFMPQFVPFGLKIFFIMRIWINLDRNCVYYFQAIPRQPCSFLWIITKKGNLGNPQVTQYLSPYAIIPLIHRESQVQVRLYRIHAVFLEFVGS